MLWIQEGRNEMDRNMPGQPRGWNAGFGLYLFCPCEKKRWQFVRMQKMCLFAVLGVTAGWDSGACF
jgi:hypothetical protein